MTTIAICDDNDRELHTIKESVEAFFNRESLPFDISSFSSGEELLADRRQFDVYILDVIMPPPNGIETALSLRSRASKGVIIFLTSSPDYAVESYRARAFYYLLKPAHEEALFPILKEATVLLNRKPLPPIPVKTSEGTIMVAAADILYAELFRRRVRYICKNETIISSTSTASFREMTEPLRRAKGFFPCGASLLINLKHVKMIRKTDAVFFNGRCIAVPRLACRGFFEAWTDFWLEENE